MGAKEIFTRIAWVPAWALALLSALLVAVLTGILNNYIEIPWTYIFWSLSLVLASFLICIIHPENVIAVPFLCNILSILPAACDNTFWTTSFGIIIGSGIVLSVISGHLGASIGRKRKVSRE
ncbi:MAG: hypothetical protein MUD02_03510 [Bacteroidales bacterium]|jgi:hypothetical protein|nr:hypothetical protein [Bacteroidales bacterium]MCU0407995.1 hypothetical protein [Bacteroidales bacterium]